KDARREEYDPRKLRNAVRIASTKRPVSEPQIDALVADVEPGLNDLGQREGPSATIGELVIERPRDLDPVAYIRFASVYRDFADLDEMRAAIDRLMPPRASAPAKRVKRPALP